MLNLHFGIFREKLSEIRWSIMIMGINETQTVILREKTGRDREIMPSENIEQAHAADKNRENAQKEYSEIVSQL